MTMLESLVYCGISITIYLLWFSIQQKTKILLINPILLTVLSIIPLLLLLNLPYELYEHKVRYIDYLVEPAVVVLGYPLYKQLALIKHHWRSIVLICLLASLTALSVCGVLASLFGLDRWLVNSMVSMNVTTAISMTTASQLGGSASIAAIVVMIAGVTGSVFGVFWLKLLNIRGQKSIGLAIGSASHALGTATIARQYPVAAAYSSTALILCAIFTAVLAPIYIPLLLDLIA